MKKILFWLDKFWPYIGGTEVFSAQLLNELQQQGYQVIVVTSLFQRKLPYHEVVNGIPIYRFPFYENLQNRNLITIKKICQQVSALKQAFKPDLVHIHSHEFSLFYHHHSHSTYPVSSMITLHVPIRYGAGQDTLLRQTLKNTAWISCVSQHLLTTTRTLMPEITAKSSLIYASLTMPSLKPTPLPVTPPKLLCIGQLTYNKGFDLALEAFPSVLHNFPNARLEIAGDGEQKSLLVQKAKQLGLSHKVKFSGWVLPEKIPALINTATMIIMPTRQREAFGLVALQAAQMRRPVVATNIGGLPEIVRQQHSGILVEKDNPSAIAAAMLSLLNNPKLAQTMGHNARQLVQQHFDFNRIVNTYKKLYDELH